MADDGIDYETLFGGETYEPCAALRALRPVLMRMIAGEHEQTIKLRDRETTFRQSNVAALQALVTQLERDCPAANPTGAPRRFAITAGTRRG